MAKREERVETWNQKGTKCAWETTTAEKGKNKQLMNIYYLPDTMLDALTHIDMLNPHKNYLQ